VNFEPIGCSDDSPKGDVLTALYYIDVRLTGTTPHLNAVNPDRFYNSYVQCNSSRRFLADVVFPTGDNESQGALQHILLNLFLGLVINPVLLWFGVTYIFNVYRFIAIHIYFPTSRPGKDIVN